MSVQDSESRRFEQTFGWVFFRPISWPKIAQELLFSGFLESLKLFFLKICAHSERYRNLLAGIFEIPTFYGNIVLTLSPVLGGGWYRSIQMKHRSAPNDRVWRITQLAKLSFNHPSVVLTADVFNFFNKNIRVSLGGGWYRSIPFFSLPSLPIAYLSTLEEFYGVSWHASHAYANHRILKLSCI